MGTNLFLKLKGSIVRPLYLEFLNLDLGDAQKCPAFLKFILAHIIFRTGTLVMCPTFLSHNFATLILAGKIIVDICCLLKMLIFLETLFLHKSTSYGSSGRSAWGKMFVCWCTFFQVFTPPCSKHNTLPQDFCIWSPFSEKALFHLEPSLN